MTVSGLSAEAGDDGQAGRGNRVNGLITPFRPMTMESVAGKNPITHVGKLYNLAAGLIAQRIVDNLPEVAEAQCALVSEIGRRIDEPQAVHLAMRPASTELRESTRRRAEDIARAELSALGSLLEDLLSGAVGLDRWPIRRA